MATFVSLVNYTDQGIRNFKESPDRFEAFRATAEKLGVTVKDVFYTVGSYDIVLILEGDDEAVASVLLKTGSLGNVRSQSMRAFTREEIGKIIGNAP